MNFLGNGCGRAILTQQPSELSLPALTDLPELVGFFSYSRDDDRDSEGGLTLLRRRIQSELRGQLGRSEKTLRLFQDAEAIPPGTLWEGEISGAIEQSAFLFPSFPHASFRVSIVELSFRNSSNARRHWAERTSSFRSCTLTFLSYTTTMFGVITRRSVPSALGSM